MAKVDSSYQPSHSWRQHCVHSYTSQRLFTEVEVFEQDPSHQCGQHLWGHNQFQWYHSQAYQHRQVERRHHDEGSFCSKVVRCIRDVEHRLSKATWLNVKLSFAVSIVWLMLWIWAEVIHCLLTIALDFAALRFIPTKLWTFIHGFCVVTSLDFFFNTWILFGRSNRLLILVCCHFHHHL